MTTNNAQINQEVVIEIMDVVEKYCVDNNINGYEVFEFDETVAIMNKALDVASTNKLYRAVFPDAPIKGTKKQKIADVVTQLRDMHADEAIEVDLEEGEELDEEHIEVVDEQQEDEVLEVAMKLEELGIEPTIDHKENVRLLSAAMHLAEQKEKQVDAFNKNVAYVLKKYNPLQVMKELKQLGLTPTKSKEENAAMWVEYKMMQKAANGESPAAATTQEEESVVEKKTFTEEEVAALLAAHSQQLEEVMQEKVEAVASATEQTSAETVAAVTGNVDVAVERSKPELIKALEAELEKLAKAKDRFIGMNMAKYRDAVEQYRAVEEHLTALKGGDVQKLIAEKYNGITRQAARAMHRTSDAVREYGHSGVDKGTELVTDIFSTVLGIARDVITITESAGNATINVANKAGHLAVDGVAGGIDAVADVINGEKRK